MMKVMYFDTHQFEKQTICDINQNFQHDIVFQDTRLNEKTAQLASGFDAVCVFVNDRLNKEVLEILKMGGTKLVALRSAGFNHVDLSSAQNLGMTVLRVPEYSPYAVAEHALALILCLNRKIHKAYNRVREGNFSLDGLVGFDIHGKNIGVIGTGKIGKTFIRLMHGFGCTIRAFDIAPDLAFAKEFNFKYASFQEVLSNSHIISLHVPLTTDTMHMLDLKAFNQMRPGTMLINTSRGKLIDTKALISVLKSGHLGAAGLDVYEEEESVFFRDHSSDILSDDMLIRLMTFPNVLLTSHQAFLTQEALHNIVLTTLQNISDFELGRPLQNEVRAG